MEFNWHKIKVGLIAVGTILTVYVVYNFLFSTPHITIDESVSVIDEDAGIEPLSGEQEEMSPVGPVGIGTLEMARFTTLNPKTKKLEREFGFEKLLHQEASQWEIDKPYMNLFRPELTCYITASKGYVVLESDTNPPSPKDAVLTGNVVAHIVPTPGSDIKESFIYLDDLSFVSAESRFSTAGPVTFVSKDAQMQGKGLEMIYDEQNKKLDSLRIEELEHLQFKVVENYSMTTTDPGSQDADAAGDITQMDPADTDKSYTCVFSGNVIIDAGEQFIAADQISISNILWSDDSSSAPAEPGKSGESLPPKQEQQSTAAEDLIEVAVSCDNGIAVVPSGSPERLEKIKGFLPDDKDYSAMDVIAEQQDRTTFGAKKINYNLASAEAVASGLSELTFYVRDVIEPGEDEQVVPVVVTAQKSVTFSPEFNRITFEGDCTCRMIRVEEDAAQNYLLSADKLIVELADEKVASGRTLAEIRGIKALNSDGSNARLSSIKLRENKFLGGVELKCPRFEYDASQQMFLARGPGVIKADNSKIPQPRKDVGRFSLQNPCYAIVRNFETLRYYIETEQIFVQNSKERIFIDYFPLNGETSEQVSITAGRIEADLVETSAGQYRLWTLRADEGISFHDRDKIFEGSELLYDDQRKIVWARGSDAMPAYFNGIVFDGIEYNMATEEVKKVEIKGPGFFSTER